MLSHEPRAGAGEGEFASSQCWRTDRIPQQFWRQIPSLGGCRVASGPIGGYAYCSFGLKYCRIAQQQNQLLLGPIIKQSKVETNTLLTACDVPPPFAWTQNMLFRGSKLGTDYSGALRFGKRTFVIRWVDINER
jgi:hypothetical protein